jgi:hypothetical protein
MPVPEKMVLPLKTVSLCFDLAKKSAVYLTVEGFQNSWRAILSLFCFHFGSFPNASFVIPNFSLNSDKDRYVCNVPV